MEVGAGPAAAGLPIGAAGAGVAVWVRRVGPAAAVLARRAVDAGRAVRRTAEAPAKIGAVKAWTAGVAAGRSAVAALAERRAGGAGQNALTAWASFICPTGGAGRPACAADPGSRARLAGAAGVTAALAIGRAARRHTCSILAGLADVVATDADVVVAAELAGDAAVSRGAAAAGEAGPVALAVAGGTDGGAGVNGADIRCAAVGAAGAGVADRRAAAGRGNTGPSLARLVQATAGHGRSGAVGEAADDEACQ